MTKELLEATLALNSSKKKEFLMSLEKIEDLLRQDNVVKSLNSKSNDAFSWDVLLIRVHDAISMEVDRANSKNIHIVDKEFHIFQNIILNICQKSVNDEMPLLNCNTIICKILSGFKSDSQINNLGSIYVELLKYVLKYRKFWGEIKMEHWIELKNLCKKCFNDPPSRTHCLVYLDALSDIVRLGCKNALISKNLLDLFPFISDIFISHVDSFCTFEVTLLRLINILCLQLAIEFRYKVCSFMEDIFDCVLSFFDKKKISRNPLIYHFFITYLNVHNPNGICKSNESFFAHDEGQWKRHMTEIYSLTQESMKEVLKNSETITIDAGLLDLIVEINYLFFTNGLHRVENFNVSNETEHYAECPGSSNKRKRSLDSSQASTVSLRFPNYRSKQIKLNTHFGYIMDGLQSSDAFFWLTILEVLLQKYPNSLEKETKHLMELLSRLVIECRDSKTVQSACRCLSVILSIENCCELHFPETENQNINDVWNQIGLELVRLLEIEGAPSYHLLIRSLITNNKFRNPLALINLYCTERIQRNVDSFFTLLTICQNCTLSKSITTLDKSNSEHHGQLRLFLLKWLFTEKVKYPVKEFSKVLISLISTRSEESDLIVTKTTETLITSRSINDLCKLITTNYELVSLQKLKFKKDLKSNDVSFMPKIDLRMLSELLKNLDAYFDDLNCEFLDDNCSYDKKLITITDSIYYCELLLNLYTYFFNFNIEIKDFNERLSKLKTLVFLITKESFSVLENKLFSVAPFVNLYGSNYHVCLSTLIRDKDCTYLSFLQILFKIFQERCKIDFTENKEKKDDLKQDTEDVTLHSVFSKLINDPRSILHVNSLTEREKLVVEVAEVLCQYIVTPGSSEQNRFQKILEMKLFDELMNADFLNYEHNFHLQLIFRIIYNFSRFDGTSNDILNKNLKLLLSIFASKKSDSEVVIIILRIMKEFVTSLRRAGDEESESNFILLLDGFRDMIVNRKRYGINTILKYVEVLFEVAKEDWKEHSKFDKSKNDFYQICGEIIFFLKHSHYEVRLFVAQRMGELFIPSERNAEVILGWQKKMINLLYNVLKDSGNSTEENMDVSLVTLYYNVMGVSVSLISWVSIVCLSTCWRRLALFHLTQLIHIGKYGEGEVHKAITLICRELHIEDETKFISDQLPYLIKKWMVTGYDLEDFPYHISRCQTLEDFFGQFSHVLLPVLLWTGHRSTAYKICKTLKKSLKQILKEYFSEFMAMILPSINENIASETVHNAVKLKNFIDAELVEDSTQLTLRNIGGIIYNMFRNIEDKNYMSELNSVPGNYFEEVKLMTFTVAQVEEAIENISQKEGKTILEELLIDKQSTIQEVLIMLIGDVEHACLTEEKIISLHKYIAFVEILSKKTSRSTFRSIVPFIIRDTVYSLKAFIHSYSSDIIVTMCLNCLKKLTMRYISEFSDILSEFLSVIVMLCTPFVRHGNSEALDILKFLICDNFEKLQPAIATLDSFPCDTAFKEVNKVLEKNKSQRTGMRSTIGHFLNVASKKRCDVEGLKYLCNVLTVHKEELKCMYDDLNTLRGFSEDCTKSLLHRLIYVLIELIADKNSAIRTEAAKCLGELGPSDLTTLILKPENRFGKVKQNESPLFRLLKACINELSELIISDSIKVKIASSALLRVILSTYEGSQVIDEESLKTKAYLRPFCCYTDGTLKLKNNSAQFENNIHQSDLWSPKDHEKWIRTISVQLLNSFTDNSGYINSLKKMVEISWCFAERMFPVILDLILSFKDSIMTEAINKNLRAFFEEYFNRKSHSVLSLSLPSLHCMVNAIDYIRIQRSLEGIFDKLDINLNYLHVAEGARRCSAYFTAILYVELWCDEKKRLEDSLTIDRICEQFSEEGLLVTTILRDCYSKIGISDGVHGCGFMHLLETSTEVQHYEHLKKWNLAALYHDVELLKGCTCTEPSLMHSLEQLGMFYSLNKLIQSSKSKMDLSDIQYKCASTLSDWNLLDATCTWQNDTAVDCYEKSHYFALKAFHDDDQLTFQNELVKAVKCTIAKLSSCSLESVQNLYQFLTELRCLKELEDFQFVVGTEHVEELKILHHKWCQQDQIKYSDFKLIESVLTQRITIVKEEFARSRKVDIKNYLKLMLCDIYYKLIRTARKEKQYETALRHINYLSRLESIPDEIVGKVKIEKSLLTWAHGEIDEGKFFLRHYLNANEIKGELKAKALRIYGDWLASTNSENSLLIIEQYYRKAIEESKSGKERVNSYASLAKFADFNYEQIKEYLSSPLFENKKNIISRQQDMVLELRQEIGRNEDREKKIACRLVERLSTIDENEIKNSESEKEFFLDLAIKYYILSLVEGEKYDLLIFRLISLWFSNLDNDNIMQQLKRHLNEIASHKFLVILPQIVPRMAEISLISTLVERCLRDHPYHALPLLFALANSCEDAKYSGVKTIPSTQRTLAARGMLEKFQKDEKLKHFMVEMERFCDAMIELANTSPREGKSAKAGTIVKIPLQMKISKLKNLRYIAVPSLTIPHRKTCSYEDVGGIKNFEDVYQLVGGVNMPKKIKCIGSDGMSRPLLVKGKDDLRQDAVMQQVFTIMNMLLRRNSETNKRKLVIRTYKVVPLSQRSGIIEWCENTQPLSLYLTGPDAKSGAHKKYNPNDLTALECRSRLRQADTTNDFKLAIFKGICSQFHPVFRYFFFENFPEAGVWFERRLAYTRSAATSSMIGHILGIGDRHVNNILIDNATAELVHIDLGIAFEQGKALPTPETVPFRLTRDIVDGMGISGVEGVFRLSCIKTMEVLRENQHAILTLLEVLLYDPLYAWTITAEKAFLVQGRPGNDSSSERSSPDRETNKMAERALVRLKQKLQGIETGGIALSAEGQVNYLIQQARDPNNLCRLFHGWQAYL